MKDDEHKLVCDALKNFPYGVAHKDLLAAIEAVLEADEDDATWALRVMEEESLIWFAEERARG